MMAMGKLQGKVALVSGSGRGIGAAIATKLAVEGARVVVNDVEAGAADETVRSIAAAGGDAIACVGDVTAADFAARFGGDEFVALLPFQTEPEAMVFAERVRSGLAKVRLVGAEGVEIQHQLTLSIGLAHFTNDGELREERALLDAADAALYEAKRRGRNCTVAYRSLNPLLLARARPH
jgi:diguanylate cyclase (GGDEF)-like protein